ncbi:metallophosphoesterase [Pleionea sediminis]|uniref:metallophosphoesterase n=1 Tax=Pleionea sediminis TaxID=2569479 RepID=UPI001FE4872E|nr:metallophosphoesterase [Pleionea sediminis]
MQLFRQILVVWIALCISSAGYASRWESAHFWPHKFEFALIGDSPYGVLAGEDYPPFDRLIDEINSDRKVRWVLHAGDIKSGSTPCSDELFMDRFNRFSQFNKPFVLTLGDNEWTDCHRVAAGEYSPLDRLAKLREIFYPQTGLTFGESPMRVFSQAEINGYEEFPENVMWARSRVLFATIHMVGSQNGLAPFDENSSMQRSSADDAEVARREQAGIDWLNKVFEIAESIKAKGVFLMVHANPALEFRVERNRLGFENTLSVLEQKTLTFGKPVILAHGDSHYFRIDKPRLDQVGFLKNFTRVETFGASRVHWIRVIVDPRSEEILSFKQEIIAANN